MELTAIVARICAVLYANISMQLDILEDHLVEPYRIEYTLRMNCIRMGRVASATEPPNYKVLASLSYQEPCCELSP